MISNIPCKLIICVTCLTFAGNTVLRNFFPCDHSHHTHPRIIGVVINTVGGIIDVVFLVVMSCVVVSIFVENKKGALIIYYIYT